MIRKRFPGSFALGLKWVKGNFIEISFWKWDWVKDLTDYDQKQSR